MYAASMEGMLRDNRPQPYQLHKLWQVQNVNLHGKSDSSVSSFTVNILWIL